MSTDPETLAFYAEGAADYAEMIARMAPDPLLAAFIAALPRGARVLDLGCGPGWAAARMAAAGLAVEATDAVPEMVAMAARHRGVSARQASFDEISGTDTHDGIWANFSLLHAPRAALPRHLAALHRALRPGGLLHIAMKLGTGERRDRFGRLYTFVTAEELDDLLVQAGFTPGSRHMGRVTGLAGDREDWIAITAHG